jgi:MFS family permease
VIVGLAFCSLAFWFGIRTSFSVFYVTLSATFPWPPGALAGAQSMALIAAMMAAPAIGALLDRFGPRKVILPGVLLLTMGLALCAATHSLFDFYIYYGLVVGTAVTAIGVVSYSVVLRHWFTEKRGFASGIAVSGMGVGVLVLSPLVQHSITLWGWRHAFLLLSALCGLFLFPATFLLLRPRHGAETGQPASETGQTRQGKAGRPGHFSHLAALRRTLALTMRQDFFRHFMLFAFLASVGVYIILVHSVKFLVDQGTSEMAAAMVLALVGAISSCFRIIWGWLSDRIGRELTYSIGSFIMCLGIGCLLLRESTGWAGHAFIFALLFGMGWGATAPSVMASSADIFNGESYGFIFGLIQSVINLGGAAGAWFGGVCFGHYHRYHGAFLLAIVAIACSCLFIWKAAPRKRLSAELETTSRPSALGGSAPHELKVRNGLAGTD